MKDCKGHKKIFVFITLCCSVLMFLSCEDSHIHGVGDITSEIRNLENFHSIHVYDNIDIDLVFNEGNAGRIEIEGGKNLIPYVRTEVVDSVLYIRNENRFTWLRSYKKSEIKMKVYCENLRYLRFDGVKTLNFRDTLHTGSFQFESRGGVGFVHMRLVADTTWIGIHTGSPDIYVEGSCNNFYLYSHAHGNTDAENFQASHVRVHIKGTSNSRISPNETLGSTIESFGNVYYRNNPQVLWNTETHEGRLIKIE